MGLCVFGYTEISTHTHAYMHTGFEMSPSISVMASKTLSELAAQHGGTASVEEIDPLCGYCRIMLGGEGEGEDAPVR